ncbi:MAG: PHP domain-containing protein, partial [Treponema sp.]|nr:PHP domain-containing protein [Treponema sp.]
MSGYPGIINDAGAGCADRAAALREFVKGGGLAAMPDFTGEINNHIHTIYSFSPYTPSMAALKSREAGLEAAGSVDHDSWAAAAEMREACAIIGLGCVTGLELRVSLKHTEFADRKFNSPDSQGIAYITVQGVPAGSEEKVGEFLKPVRAARRQRNIRMTENINSVLAAAGLGGLDYERDVIPLSMYHKGGSVTERHLLFALSLALIREAGRGEKLLAFLGEKFGIEVGGKNRGYLLDPGNPYCAYDLLGVLKSSFNDRIFIQPGSDECPPVETVTAFARSINAVPFYAYLGDITESVTGDKKAEKFEDDYIDRLVPRLKDLGFQGLTYMPPRNTMAQLIRLRRLCEKQDLLEISGVDINTPRQVFQCPEIRKDEFKFLTDT